MKTITLTRDKHRDVALPVDFEFAGVYADATCEGALAAAKAKVAFVGLARDIAGILPASIGRIQQTARHFADWRAFVVENDSTDGTKDILRQWATDDPGHVIVELADDGKTMICVTHEMGLARAMADRVILLDAGQIVEDAPPEKFFTAPESERTRQFLSRVLHH